jgi:hypothetical protein
VESMLVSVEPAMGRQETSETLAHSEVEAGRTGWQQ